MRDLNATAFLFHTPRIYHGADSLNSFFVQTGFLYFYSNFICSPFDFFNSHQLLQRGKLLLKPPSLPLRKTRLLPLLLRRKRPPPPLLPRRKPPLRLPPKRRPPPRKPLLPRRLLLRKLLLRGLPRLKPRRPPPLKVSD